MKVILINGSRREHGCTRTALDEVAGELKACGIESEIIFIGNRAVNGKINEAVSEVGEKMREADGLIVGSPVYYASPSGEVIAFLDRLFWNYGSEMMHKPGASVVSCRRGGNTASFDVLNKYFTITQMPVVSSQYWNMVHGNTPDEVRQDAEGLQTMRTLARNMAWLLECIRAGREKGIALPAQEERQGTNFIR
ncbi:MAG: flavodoxin family protein [Clostridia bacterium]|nr:flavodoxin family protein [Clostridia bacterium]